MEPQALIRATVYEQEQPVQHQIYDIHNGEGFWEIKEQGEFPTNESIAARCDFRVSPKGYERLSVQFHHPSMDVTCDVQLLKGNWCELTHNGNTNRIQIEPGNCPILFDGPNPLFDYMNAILLLGLPDGGREDAVVQVLDWGNGNVIPVNYSFERQGQTVEITRDCDFLPGSTFELGPSLELLRHSNGTQTTIFH